MSTCILPLTQHTIQNMHLYFNTKTRIDETVRIHNFFSEILGSVVLIFNKTKLVVFYLKTELYSGHFDKTHDMFLPLSHTAKL